MRLFRSLALSVFATGCFYLPSSAMAGDNGLALPPEGQTVINLSATERKTMPQDLLMASLRIEVEDKDSAATIQKKINDAMAKALDVAKKESDLKVSTGAYSVYKNERTVPDTKTGFQKSESFWQGSQTIDIESKNATKLLDIVGKIQAMGFAMNNLAYTLSPEAAEKAQDEMMVAALKKLTAKADVIAKTLGKAKADLVDVNVDTGGPVYPMQKQMMRRAELVTSDAMPAPVAQAGETDITLTVSARALIKP